MPVRWRLPAPERVHLNPARRAGTLAEQAGPDASRDDPAPTTATARTARPEDEHTKKTTRHPAHPPRPAPTNQPRQDHDEHHPRSHDKQVPFSRRISTVLASNKYRSRGQRGGEKRGGAPSTAGPVSGSGNQSAGLVTGTGPATGQRAWQRGHQKRRRPATSLAATGVAQRRQGRPVRW